VGYEEAESRVLCAGGAISCQAAEWHRKWACGPNKKNVCIPVWKHETKIVVVDCSVEEKDLGIAGLIETW